MDRSARSLWRYIYRPQFIFPTRVHSACALPSPSSPLSLFLSRLSLALLPRLVNLDPGNAAKEGCAQKEVGGGAKERCEGNRRLKYHQGIIRYRRVIYSYRYLPYNRIKQPFILIHDGSATRRDGTRRDRLKVASSRVAEIRKIAL